MPEILESLPFLFRHWIGVWLIGVWLIGVWLIGVWLIGVWLIVLRPRTSSELATLQDTLSLGAQQRTGIL
jgi:hypothetical protein